MEDLLDNAWKFTQKNSQARIEFGIMKQDGKECFFVRDNGVGFDMAYADKLFGPSSVSIPRKSSPAPASDWLRPSASSTATGAGSGRNRTPEKGQRSTSGFIGGEGKNDGRTNNPAGGRQPDDVALTLQSLKKRDGAGQSRRKMPQRNF
jgi:hypothetical protein